MIAIDSSVVIDLLADRPTATVEVLAALLEQGHAVIPPPALTELLSDVGEGRIASPILMQMKLVPLSEGYWQRAGLLRAKVRREGRKAAFGDALIAQCCIDADLPLLTEDTDFGAFAKFGGLKLA